MEVLKPGPSSLRGLRWLAQVGPAPLQAWAVAMGWGQAAVYSHARRLRAAGWLERCSRPPGEPNLVYASRAGVRRSGVDAAVLQRPPRPVTWPHVEASAWTAAWLTARGRELQGPRQLLVQEAWRGEVLWRERGESRQRGHRPDLAGQLPDGRWMPIEVELTEKSSARLKAVIGLHASWVAAGRTPAVMYVCGSDGIAERVSSDAHQAGLSVERETLRVELLPVIQHQAVQACKTATDWHCAGTSQA
jgi:hypothetical protein